ncbi:FAD-binding oxidoreductase [Cocleimonas flava]|uniref:D-amino-acid dehydrogenase n=2 Tax=Cocleimonas flava TaxID=634765 RepID=A0A4R1ETS2_9GAMM|nr:D-amino-acid dehydrogenase [Cocleimonas flava]
MIAMNKEPVTIIGAGIVGICCALSLAKRGVPVRLIDRDQPGQGTSFGNAGVISPWSIIPMALPGLWKKIPSLLLSRDRPLSVSPEFWPQMISWGSKLLLNSNEESVRKTADTMSYLCGPSIELFREHLMGTGHENLIVDSYYVHVFRDANKVSLDNLDYRIRLEKGGDLELITDNELRRFEPALSPKYKAAVIIKGQARTLSPGKLSEVLVEKAKSLGVEVINLDVSSIRKQADGWEIEGNGSHLTSSRVILAAGVWSKKLLEPLGVKVPLATERGYHIEISDPQVELNNSIMDMEAKIVASTMMNGLRLAGAAEFAHPDKPADQSREGLLTTQAKTMFPDLNVGKTNFWMGRRPSFPDSLPMLGEIEGQKDFYAAFGHSHFGLMMAPKTGEVLADILTGKKPDFDMKAFSLRRFKMTNGAST